MSSERNKILKARELQSKYIRYADCKKLYGIGRTKFIQLANEAHAVIKVDRLALVDRECFERYMESFRKY